MSVGSSIDTLLFNYRRFIVSYSLLFLKVVTIKASVIPFSKAKRPYLSTSLLSLGPWSQACCPSDTASYASHALNKVSLQQAFPSF